MMEEENSDSNGAVGEDSTYHHNSSDTQVTNVFQLEAQSRELYSNFLREELQSEGFQIPGDIPQYLFFIMLLNIGHLNTHIF